MGERRRFIIVGDNSGHDYVIPLDKQDNWSAFMSIDEDDPTAWDVPKWARRINGPWTFTDPQGKFCDG